MYKYALNVNAIPYLAFNVANIIKSIFGKNKKGFVLDLDNTLWGGVVGDDGVDNLVIGPEESEGQVYLEFQRYIKEHKQLGIILNIDSKNDYINAEAGLNHPNCELHCDDFVIIKAGWGTVTEAMLSKVPMVLLEREEVLEDSHTINELKKQNKAISIKVEELRVLDMEILEQKIRTLTTD